MKKIDPRKITDNAIQLIGGDWMLVTAGTPDSFNMMTASWGGMGFMWQKPVMFVFIRPQRYTFGMIEAEEAFTISFFEEKYRSQLTLCGRTSGRDTDKVKETGFTPMVMEGDLVSFKEARLVLECKKLYTDMIKFENFIDQSLVQSCYADGSTHKMYVVEIVGAWVAE